MISGRSAASPGTAKSAGLCGNRAVSRRFSRQTGSKAVDANGSRQHDAPAIETSFPHHNFNGMKSWANLPRPVWRSHRCSPADAVVADRRLTAFLCQHAVSHVRHHARRVRPRRCMRRRWCKVRRAAVADRQDQSARIPERSSIERAVENFDCRAIASRKEPIDFDAGLFHNPDGLKLARKSC